MMDMKEKKVMQSFRLSPNVLEKLKVLADLEGRSPTNMLEWLITEAFKQKEKSV